MVVVVVGVAAAAVIVVAAAVPPCLLPRFVVYTPDTSVGHRHSLTAAAEEEVAAGCNRTAASFAAAADDEQYLGLLQKRNTAAVPRSPPMMLQEKSRAQLLHRGPTDSCLAVAAVGAAVAPCWRTDWAAAPWVPARSHTRVAARAAGRRAQFRTR